MSRIIKLFVASFIVVLSFVAVTAPRALAFDPLQETCDNSKDANNSQVCKDSKEHVGTDLASSSNGVIVKVANIIAAVGGIIAVVFVMINGLTLLTSAGDSAKLNKARDGLIYAAVGIVIIVLARVVVAFILRFV